MVYVQGHYRNGYWVGPYYRRSPGATESVAVCRKKHVQETAGLCSDLITDGWQNTVAKRAADYVTQRTWQGIRRTKNCKALATLARKVLAGQQELHNIIGATAQSLTSLLGANKYEQALAQELAAKLPLPWDAKLIAMARSIQITGIFICVTDGKTLTQCQCFIDLSRTETQEHVKKIVAAALGDWAHLGNVSAATHPIAS